MKHLKQIALTIVVSAITAKLVQHVSFRKKVESIISDSYNDIFELGMEQLFEMN